MPRTKLLLAIVWLCFLIRGAFYCTVFPLWEGFDEYAHFAYIQYFAQNGTLPHPKDTNISREIESSLRLAPLPWMMGYLPAPFLTHDDYWKLPPEERHRRVQALRQLKPDLTAGTMVLYEAQQPPLYYAMFAAVYHPIAAAPLGERVWLLRLFGLILGSFGLFLAFRVALDVFHDERRALCVTALIAAMPELMINLCRVSNEPLALVLATLLLLFTVRVRPIALGVTLGLALLTKAYFLTAIPAVLLILKSWRQRIVVFALATPLAGWFYWRNWRLSGSISGVLQDAALAGKSRLGLFQLIPQVDWWRAADSTFLSHIWFGGWSFLQVRSWMYRIFAVLFLLAIVGLFRRRPKPEIIVLTTFLGTFLAGLAYHVLLTFAANGQSSSAGWYLYAFVVAEATLLIAGWTSLFPRLSVLPIFTACFVALELFGTHFYLIPYYTGLTAHQPNGRVPALALGELARIPERLSPLAAALWLPFLVATLALVAIPAICAKVERSV